jgi:colanic acid biosynthesis glycosyl transferase WcaI
MRVLVISGYYAPDLGPGAPLYTMLCESLARRGHQVTVISAVPNYPSGKVQESFRGARIRSSTENGVNVIRVPVPSVRRANLILRFIQFSCYQLGATWAGLFKRFDIALVANPAIGTGLPFITFVTLRRKRSIMLVHDVYPDVGVKLGIFKNRPVITAVAWVERLCLSRSTLVRITSNSFKAQLNALGVADSKMALVYDWVDTELIQPLSQDNDYTRENELVGRFVVLYAGNIGLSQGLEHVLGAAEQLINHEDILFLFVGDGAGRELLMNNARQKNIQNVKFLPFQPRIRLPLVLASADISIISLRRGVGMESLPSKTFSIMASGRPIIACVDEKCETWHLIQMAQAGICVPPESTPDLVRAIIKLKENEELRRLMGQNGRRWAQIYHSPDSAAEQFELLMAKALYEKYLKEKS